jgi:hypothetical protein
MNSLFLYVNLKVHNRADNSPPLEAYTEPNEFISRRNYLRSLLILSPKLRVRFKW